MNRRPLSLVPLVVPVAAVLLAGAAQASSADPPTDQGQPAAVATGSQSSSPKTDGLAPLAAFKGYQQVSTAALTDPAAVQSSGSVACPSGTKLVGGGAIISSSSLGESINSSVPLSDGLTWRVYINNTSSTAGTFRVYADCVKRVPNYSVVAGTGVDNPAGTQTTATVTCPTKTVPLGGGGLASFSGANLNTTVPLSNGWRIDVSNPSTGNDAASAYVICGTKPSGYQQVAGTPATVGANAQGDASVTCPTGKVVLSGGQFAGSASTMVDVNSSVPSGSSSWITYENNGSSAATSLTAYAVCAKATL